MKLMKLMKLARLVKLAKLTIAPDSFSSCTACYNVRQYVGHPP